VAVLAALAALAVPAAGAMPQTSADGGAPEQSVIVKLRAQADLTGLGSSRAARLRELVTRLQETADREQAPLLPMLEAWQKAGLVSHVTPLWILDGFAVTAEPQVVEALRRLPMVESVTPDGTITPQTRAASTSTTEWNVAKVNAPALWALGYTGQGVVVATMDTGVDVTHPDLASRWRGGSNSWYDPYGQRSTPVDLVGHGTQVMGIIVGGDASGVGVGVAPGARWIAARIYDDRGKGKASAVHLAFQWLLDPDHDPSTADAPQVVNGSWTYGTGCNLEFAPDIQALRAADIVPVFAAGNDGSVDDSPANNPGALAVGATDGNDAIASSSSRGPSSCGEPPATFPELTAPGVSIRTTDLFGGYAVQNGTSLAAPHVAGALALLLGAYSSLSPESALESTARDLGNTGPDNVYGYGRIDVLAAYEALAQPDFTIASDTTATTWAGGTALYDVTVTRRAGFSGGVTLSADGLPPGATAAFDPATVADGSGSSTLSITTSPALAEGSYPFTVTGTSGTLAHSVQATLVVTPPPDFALTVSPSSAATSPGGSVSFAVGVSALYGFDGTVSLDATGVPDGATATFAPGSVSASGSSTLNVSTTSGLAPGTYPLAIHGSAGALTHSAQVTLVVNPAPTFTLSVSPPSITIRHGHQGSLAVSTGSVGGFSSPVALSVTGLPSNVTGSFSPNPVSPGSSSTLTLRVAAKAARGSVTITITASSAGTSRTQAVTLTVT
ncbi:MAG TPA: S8 family serine peptidase, partial [Gaiellaceae bacterium]|nr:S8 family serine peptidase [Gaiellaceae bacterium]